MAGIAERRLILNADDYGFSSGVNAGILECVAAGTVTSVSVLVNTPGFEDGMRRLHSLARPPGVGLHLNLTAGEPVLSAREVPSLVNARGRLLPTGMLAARALLGAVNRADVERECCAQLERLRSRWPDVDHLDSHQHVHVLPGLAGAVRSAAAGANLRPVRCPVEPVGTHRGALKRLLLATAWSLGSGGTAGHSPVRVRGIGLVGGAGFLADLLALIDRAQPGLTELIVHPGHTEPELAAWDPYLGEREAELAALLSAPLRERLARGDVALADFRRA